MILALHSSVTSLALAGAGNSMAPLQRIEHLIDVCAQTNDFDEALELFSKFHRAVRSAKLQDLVHRTTELDEWAKQARRGKADQNQWLININIFFQDLQNGDADDALEALARHPAAAKLLV